MQKATESQAELLSFPAGSLCFPWHAVSKYQFLSQATREQDSYKLNTDHKAKLLIAGRGCLLHQSTSAGKRHELYATQVQIKKKNLSTLRGQFRTTGFTCCNSENVCMWKMRQLIALVETPHHIQWFNFYYLMLTDTRCILTLFGPSTHIPAGNKAQQSKLLILESCFSLHIMHADMFFLFSHLLPFIILIQGIFPLISVLLALLSLTKHPGKNLYLTWVGWAWVCVRSNFIRLLLDLKTTEFWGTLNGHFVHSKPQTE